MYEVTPVVVFEVVVVILVVVLVVVVIVIVLLLPLLPVRSDAHVRGALPLHSNCTFECCCCC